MPPRRRRGGNGGGAARVRVLGERSDQQRRGSEALGEIGGEGVLVGVGLVAEVGVTHAATTGRRASVRAAPISGMSRSASRTRPPFDVAWSAISRSVAGFSATAADWS